MTPVNKTITVLSTALILLVSCDRIDESMIEKIGTTGPTTDTTGVEGKILVEYFTGHGCGNCPGSSNPASEDLHRLHGDRVVFMTIHAGFFATPAMISDKLDLTSAAGTRIYTDAGVTSVPIGRVNRRASSGSVLLSPSSWTTAASEVAPTRSPFSITDSIEYSTSSRSGTVTVTATAHKDTAAAFNVYCYVLEDSIVGIQLDFEKTPNEVPGYVFNHVLRNELTPADGNSLAASPVTNADTSTKAFPLVLKSTWNEAHCSVVTVITEAVSGEVVQVSHSAIVKQ